MRNRKVARKYNLALYLTAEELKAVDSVKKDIYDIKKTLDNSRELRNFVESPVVKPDVKSAALTSIFSGKLNDLTMKFLVFLSDKGRINFLNDIIDDFLYLVNEKQGIVLASVKTAVDISEKEKASLTAKLKQYTGKDITATYTVDPSIKGGFIAKIDDKIIDASISRQLELLKEKFLQGSFNN